MEDPRVAPSCFIRSTKSLRRWAVRLARSPAWLKKTRYRGLRAAGVETEMVIYHDERHGITRLDRQADIYRRILDWFARHDVDP